MRGCGFALLFYNSPKKFPPVSQKMRHLRLIFAPKIFMTMKITVHHISERTITEYDYNGRRVLVGFTDRLNDEIEGLTGGDVARCLMLSPCGARVGAPGEEFTFDGFKIIPIADLNTNGEVCAYSIEADGVRVFHIGGVHAHSSECCRSLARLKKLIGKAHYIVYEDTSASILEAVIKTLKPRAVIPAYSGEITAVDARLSDIVPVILLHDGESCSPIRDPGFDTVTAFVLARKTPEADITECENPFRLPWWSLDKRFLGEFACWDDADFVLRHVAYAPGRLLGYEIESDEDMAPWLYAVYNPDFTELAQYEEGGHAPGEPAYGQEAPFGPGELVLALVPDIDALVPAVVEGPLTEEFLRRQFDADIFSVSDTFEEYIEKLWDWDWDQVVVRPLVQLANRFTSTSPQLPTQRIYLFPCPPQSTD